MFDNLTPEQIDNIKALLKQSGSDDKAVALAAQHDIAAALTLPLRSAFLTESNIGNIFDRQNFEPTADIVYPLDFYRVENSKEFKAYAIPAQGRIPERLIESEEIRVTTYRVGNSIDFLLKYARDARFDIVSRAFQVLEAGFAEKANDDGWHLIMQAGFDRGLMIGDSSAAAGQFTKRLVSLMKLTMARGVGGSGTKQGVMTHLFVSPEALEDMRNWDADDVDDITRREIYVADDSGAVEIFGVKIVPLLELGEGQPYQEYYTGVIAAGEPNNGMASGTDVEIVIGLDLTNRDAFVMPTRQPIQIFEDEALHRFQKQGYYGWTEYGMAVLNVNHVLLGSL